MFTLWRKLELAESVYFRPLASYSNSLSSFNQIDVVKKDSVTVGHEPEVLETKFKSATHPLQVLSTLPTNSSDYRSMPGETVIRALQTIAVLQRANKDTVKCDFITTHPSFEQLCRRLKRCSTMFTPDELVKSLRFLCSLGVPTNSELSLVLLNLIRHEINNLSVNKIIYLDYILSQTECRSELQKTIQTSLPLVFELQVTQQIDKENSVPELVSILNYLANHKNIDIENENMKVICKILCDKHEEIRSEDAINIIYHLCLVERFTLKNSIKLMATSIRRLMDQITEVDIKELQKVINRLVAMTVNQLSPFQFHLHSLLKCTAERISQADLGLPAALELQMTIKNINFQCVPLLKYIGDKMVSNVDSCQTMAAFQVFIIIQAFANNCYIPENPEGTDNIWSDRIVPAILANKNLASYATNNYVWLPFTLQLVILGQFNQELISRVLSSSYLEQYLSRKDLSADDLHKILVLYQTASMQPNIDLSSVDKKMISNVCKSYIEKLSKCNIQSDLIDRMGTMSVLTNVRTKHMHIIHTLIKFNKKTGQIEPFSADITRDEDGFVSLDDVSCKDNEVLVCVDSLKRYHLFSNISARKSLIGVREVYQELKRGTFRLRPKQLEQLGVSVCEINYRRYRNLGTERKANYLQERIAKHTQNTEQGLD